ncbi:hypothetical protein [Rhodanobacter sp. C01]|uniref:hypothetical protein n=1 Tax=Rhodanobacter sp. C01 TaxID=1945856 RepID=UPI0011158E0F|nr:hypothetical protein [Rhodanobacter sp. C01]
MAQTSTPVSSSQGEESWAWQPVAASSAGYRDQAPTAVAASGDHFKFKDRRQDQDGPLSQPPPSAMDRTAVMGGDRPWLDGRPPVDCVRTPMDPTCRH